MRTNQGDELQFHLYLQGSQSTDEGRPGDRVCELWMCGMRFERLEEGTPRMEDARETPHAMDLMIPT